MENHLAENTWFAGDHLSIADFQMSFAVEAALARGDQTSSFPRLNAYKEKMETRPAYQRALAKGGSVIMSA
jgi:glutathione S-transferase